jgi:transposase
MLSLGTLYGAVFVDVREQKGREIANSAIIKKMGDAWIVPSQSGAGSYRVSMESGEIMCSCPDFELRRSACKHVYAAAFFVQRTTVTEQIDAFGTTTTTTVTETAATVRVSYPQRWAEYNKAQCAEKEITQSLLRSLCDGIQGAPQTGRGRPKTPLSDVVYGLTMKVYTTASGRRATTDIEACSEAGYMTTAPRYNTLFDYMDKPELTDLLTVLVEESAAPLACVESRFAADATGFGTTTYHRWFDHKYGREKKVQGWVKAHAMIGTTTNIITAIRVTNSNMHDSPELPALVESTAERFKVAEVSADKAYLSHANLTTIEKVGAVPYIPFKSNSQGEGSAAWRRMWGLFMYRQPEFLQHYHLRSNAESTFSAMKRKFGPSVRSKNPTAQVNEVLCKALCFNLSMLVHAMFELGIEPTFFEAA